MLMNLSSRSQIRTISDIFFCQQVVHLQRELSCTNAKEKQSNNILFNHKSIYYHFAGIEQIGSIKKVNDSTEVNTNKPSGSQVKILGCYICIIQISSSISRRCRSSGTSPTNLELELELEPLIVSSTSFILFYPPVYEHVVSNTVRSMVCRH